MIHMTPYQSWTTLILLLVIAGILIWLVRALRQQSVDRARAAGRAAVVIALKPTKRRRHLALVPDLPRQPSPKLYDWQIHGL